MKKLVVLAVLLGVVILALAGGAWNVFAKTGWCGTVQCEVEPQGPRNLGPGGSPVFVPGEPGGGGGGTNLTCAFVESNETVICGVTHPSGTPANVGFVYQTYGPAAGGTCTLVLTPAQTAAMAGNANIGLLFSANGATWEKLTGSVSGGTLTVDCTNKVGYFALGAL